MHAAISGLVAAKIHPTRDNVLVRRRPSEKATAGGVIIPETVRKSLNLGSVVAVGPGRRTPGGTLIPPCVAPGDEVVLDRDRGTEITLAGEQFIVVSEQDVLGVFVAPDDDNRLAPAAVDVTEPISEWERKLLGTTREESLETDVAPGLLDREAPTGEDLH